MDYQTPTSAQDAAKLLSQEGAQVLAGGTDLLVKMRAGMTEPATIVDIKRVPGLRGIEHGPKGWRIGAATSCAEIGEHAELAAAWPGVVEALQLIGSTQIQGRATLGGNLCNASPAADSVPALIAAGAVCEVAGETGEREVPVEDIVAGPGKNTLARGEFLVGFRLPEAPAGSGDAYLRLIPRSEMDIAVVGAGVALVVDAGGKCTQARVALGAVAPTPLLVADAAAALIGTKVDDDALAALAAAASKACKPIDDKRGTVAYRVKVSGVLARRAARIAYQRATAK
ncbi:MAG: xanthine dehydrogenase family protein subunit M [Burkholderiales bacterium]|jgi:carbon-monoxide dehydrogenase medium subunit